MKLFKDLNSLVKIAVSFTHSASEVRSLLNLLVERHQDGKLLTDEELRKFVIETERLIQSGESILESL